ARPSSRVRISSAGAHDGSLPLSHSTARPPWLAAGPRVSSPRARPSSGLRPITSDAVASPPSGRTRTRSARARGGAEAAKAPPAASSLRNERRNGFMISSGPARGGVWVARLDQPTGGKFRVYCAGSTHRSRQPYSTEVRDEAD